MSLTRRVQVFISPEASAALDKLTPYCGGQKAAIEYALIATAGTASLDAKTAKLRQPGSYPKPKKK